MTFALTSCFLLRTVVTQQCPQIGRKNPQNGRKHPQTDAHLKKWSNLQLQDHTERAHQLANPRVSIQKYCPGRANSIITRMASQLRAVHAKQQPARIATTLFIDSGNFFPTRPKRPIFVQSDRNSVTNHIEQKQVLK